jgi:hypothetical protein
MGFITDALGLTDTAGQEAATRNAAEAMSQIKKLSKEQINFNMEVYDKWKDIYGDVFDDLGTYFKNLTGDKQLAMQMTQIQKQTQLANEQLAQEFAARGVSDSGLAMDAYRKNIYNGALAKANAGATVDSMVAQQKLGFAQLGASQQANILGNINAGYGSAMNSFGGVLSGQSQVAANLAKGNSLSVGGLIGTGLRAFKII